MPQRPARFCGKCHRTAEPGSPPRCAMHRAMPDSRHGDRGPLEKFYNCARWRPHTRRAILSRDPMCQNTINGSPCLRLSTDVHHKVDAEEWVAAGNDFYDQDNLQGLCHTCHTAIRRGQRGK
jgi:hypothetical protein